MAGENLFTPFALFVPGWVEEDVVSPLLLSPLVHVSDGKEFGLVFHKEVVVENPTDVSIEPEALSGSVKRKSKDVFIPVQIFDQIKNLGGAVKTVRIVSLVATETGWGARLQLLDIRQGGFTTQATTDI